ncbi:helix-turn-helix domain-containing protein [Leuconostoc mesenteroides]|jgi:transcriptional regulator with XRE-family HTH domain|uniref:Transcriptional regulator, xre family n=1 Tax=Leuconostoc mesenteroides subsp. mesenteroides (strain ATCC 8293 / DSM 20343 / BCRC 11652 / CCM 1803 / JCM 6124 / NCDO 523 / NBRC 100496 / NCIMB 8023 / NCTC 12954 / NRRL B-1118 / 37Y) TaxID=203120 RepID=Q03VJ3_LEUMM|nr:helix-turn-helix transcriptional regulator [Leuconostoc mesenteroides]ABJ62779.1 Transcriptional regulator, xre family [Leuconostoc mesenteroides subsp. mesenteroides ATCC 8293]MBZ1527781.1 helix-turn-helix transcriptional regulator [Leuconostoc mesenteroides]MCI2152362.1 helix-turn-helix transcriptional regulator [Leuconostoc mesenteroides]MCI2168020.1 helix-turn-helix transcriptional regulator [Leuconostoc mesenteroides]MCT3042566.1 XRE family transcriptional regulator [Leuconostoc mesent
MTLLSRTKDTVKKRGISMERLAKEIGISKSGIYQWDVHEPKPSTINKAADFLHVSVDYLMERTDDMNPTSSDDLTEPQKQVAYFIDPQATKEDIEQIKKLVEIAKLSKRRL